MSDTLIEKTSKRASSTLEDIAYQTLDLAQVKSRLTKSVADFLYGETRRRPTILTVIEQV